MFGMHGETKLRNIIKMYGFQVDETVRHSVALGFQKHRKINNFILRQV